MDVADVVWALWGLFRSALMLRGAIPNHCARRIAVLLDSPGVSANLLPVNKRRHIAVPRHLKTCWPVQQNGHRVRQEPSFRWSILRQVDLATSNVGDGTRREGLLARRRSWRTSRWPFGVD